MNDFHLFSWLLRYTLSRTSAKLAVSLRHNIFIELNMFVSASQQKLTNRYQWIDFILSKRWFSSAFIFFCFLIIHHNSIFANHVRRVCYSNNWKGWHLHCNILKLFTLFRVGEKAPLTGFSLVTSTNA